MPKMGSSKKGWENGRWNFKEKNRVASGEIFSKDGKKELKSSLKINKEMAEEKSRKEDWRHDWIATKCCIIFRWNPWDW